MNENAGYDTLVSGGETYGRDTLAGGTADVIDRNPPEPVFSFAAEPEPQVDLDEVQRLVTEQPPLDAEQWGAHGVPLTASPAQKPKQRVAIITRADGKTEELYEGEKLRPLGPGDRLLSLVEPGKEYSFFRLPNGSVIGLSGGTYAVADASDALKRGLPGLPSILLIVVGIGALAACALYALRFLAESMF